MIKQIGYLKFTKDRPLTKNIEEGMRGLQQMVFIIIK